MRQSNRLSCDATLLVCQTSIDADFSFRLLLFIIGSSCLAVYNVDCITISDSVAMPIDFNHVWKTVFTVGKTLLFGLDTKCLLPERKISLSQSRKRYELPLSRRVRAYFNLSEYHPKFISQKSNGTKFQAFARITYTVTIECTKGFVGCHLLSQ